MSLVAPPDILASREDVEKWLKKRTPRPCSRPAHRLRRSRFPVDPGTLVSLADFAGKGHVLVYFYPKDDTPGCTKEACSLRDGFAELQRSGRHGPRNLTRRRGVPQRIRRQSTSSRSSSSPTPTTPSTRRTGSGARRRGAWGRSASRSSSVPTGRSSTSSRRSTSSTTPSRSSRLLKPSRRLRRRPGRPSRQRWRRRARPFDGRRRRGEEGRAGRA